MRIGERIAELRRLRVLAWVFLLMILTGLGCGKAANTTGDTPPAPEEREIQIAADKESGSSPLTIVFSVTKDPAIGELSTYNWDFGDGGTSGEAGPTHIFQVSGEYTVTLRAATADSHEYTATKTINVTKGTAEYYLALNIDNYWKYKYTVYQADGSVNYEYYSSMKIEKTQNIEGKQVYLYYYGMVSPIYFDSTGIYRARINLPTNLGDFERVLRLPFVVGDEYLLPGSAGWGYYTPDPSGKRTTTISIIDLDSSIDALAGHYDHCIKIKFRYYYADSLAPDKNSEAYIYLAPGIGLVKSQSYGYQRQGRGWRWMLGGETDLVESVINNNAISSGR